MDLGISEAGRRIIDAIIDAPVAWRSPGELAERLGWDLERALDEIADLDARGWLEAWELVDGPVVTLSVAATASCGVRLVEVGRDATPRWARPDAPEPACGPALGVSRLQAGPLLDLVADARPGVEALAILAEEAEARALAGGDGEEAARISKLPRPTQLLGTSLTPWPGPAQVSGDVCPSCLSAQLRAREYCLRCDRWGLDHALIEVPPERSQPRRPSGRGPAKKAEGRQHEVERKKRQGKRQERRRAQTRKTRLGLPALPAWSGPVAI